jgi:hypothetical protein
MKLLLKRLLSYVPTPVPTGMTKFDDYVADIIALSGPIASPEDIEWVVDAEMMRIGPRQSRIPKNYFVSSIKSAAAKQLAGARFTALKEKQQAAIAAKQAEATAHTNVVADEQPQG